MESKKKTPLLQELRKVGGTLYVFPSASEDIGLNLLSTTTGVAMSHYALLNLPQLSKDDLMCDSGLTAADGNKALAMSLQNYMMNFETLLTNNKDYNYQELSTVTEKVFWHWAEKVGIIKKSNFAKIDDTSVYYETGRDGDAKNPDNTVIKCFGSIDAGNSLSTEFGMYNETYINVPTSYGAGPVYLKSDSTSNYTLDLTYVSKDPTHLEGRDDTYSYYSYTNGQDIPFFDDKSKSAYITNKEFDGLEIVKDIPTIQSLVRKQFTKASSAIISSYDDLNIDTENYFDVDQKFEFNAILLYYSVYDQDDLVKTAYATNLFGIIFLDGCQLVSSTSGDGYYIPVKTKLKSTTDSFGDSFSFRVNLKTMSVYDNTDAIIQDNTTMSGIYAVDFSDAISNMNKAIDIMNSNMHTTAAIQDQYAAIMAYYDSQEQAIDDLSTNLNAYLKGTRSSLVNTSTLYTNVISPNPINASNDLRISTVIAQNGAEVTVNPNPEIYVSANNVKIPVLDVSTALINRYYVYEDRCTSTDMPIFTTKNNNDVSVLFDTLDRMFKQSDSLVIKLKDDKDIIATNGERHDKVYNQLYVDPASAIFDKTTDHAHINYLINSSSNIDYTRFVPYLIAQIQRLTAEIEELKKK